MNLVEVQSSNLGAVGYDAESNTLRIVFSNGTMYDYSNVPSDVYDALLNAPSIGRYFHQAIKNKYPFTRIS